MDPKIFYLINNEWNLSIRETFSLFKVLLESNFLSYFKSLKCLVEQLLYNIKIFYQGVPY